MKVPRSARALAPSATIGSPTRRACASNAARRKWSSTSCGPSPTPAMTPLSTTNCLNTTICQLPALGGTQSSTPSAPSRSVRTTVVAGSMVPLALTIAER